MIQHLKKLLLGPGRAAVGSQVVENKQGSILYPLEEIIITHVAGRTERSAQMIKKVGNDGPEDGYSLSETVIGDSSRHMRLAAATGPGENQPPLNIIGIGPRLLIAKLELPLPVRIFAQPLRSQIIKGESSQRPQIAVTLKPLDSIPGEFPQAALAGERSPEIRVLHRHIQDYPTMTLA